MVSLLCGALRGSCKLERMSYFMVLLPGQYVTVNANLEKKYAHLAYRAFRHLAPWRKTKFYDK